jgi:3-deoxy-D-manno-octulosonic-acid transferase
MIRRGYFFLAAHVFPLLQFLGAQFSPKIKQRVSALKVQKVNTKGAIWFHCSSLGEYEMAMPLIQEFLDNSQDHILVSFFSASGYGKCEETSRISKIYLPLDSQANAAELFKNINPKAFILVKYEFWLGYMEEAIMQGIPSFLVSGLLRPGHFMGKFYGKPWRRALARFEGLYMQNQESVEIAEKMGLKATHSGDLRFNRVLENKAVNLTNPIFEHFAGQHKILLILGSSWSAEEKMLSKLTLPEGLGVIIAPHDISAKHIKEIKTLFPASQSYTDYIDEKSKVLILNTIGQLKYAYQYGHFAFIGGAFGKGLHNILEPMAYGLPVIFGPHHDKFPEGRLAIEQGIGFEVNSESELQNTIDSLYLNYKNYESNIKKWVSSMQVNTSRIFAQIQASIKKGHI